MTDKFWVPGCQVFEETWECIHGDESIVVRRADAMRILSLLGIPHGCTRLSGKENQVGIELSERGITVYTRVSVSDIKTAARRWISESVGKQVGFLGGGERTIVGWQVVGRDGGFLSRSRHPYGLSASELLRGEAVEQALDDVWEAGEHRMVPIYEDDLELTSFVELLRVKTPGL